MHRPHVPGPRQQGKASEVNGPRQKEQVNGADLNDGPEEPDQELCIVAYQFLRECLLENLTNDQLVAELQKDTSKFSEDRIRILRDFIIKEHDAYTSREKVMDVLNRAFPSLQPLGSRLQALERAVNRLHAQLKLIK